jgi:hypothetical protein
LNVKKIPVPITWIRRVKPQFNFLLLFAKQCCGSESESESIRKFWPDPSNFVSCSQHCCKKALQTKHNSNRWHQLRIYLTRGPSILSKALILAAMN